MKVAMLIAPKDFKDESVSKTKLMLEKWGIQVVITSYSTHDCIGYHGAVYKTDLNAGKLNANDFDALILIDGKGVDDYKLYDFRPLLDTVKLFNMKNKPIAAINNAIKIVARTNIVNGVKIAIPNDEESRRMIILYHAVPSKNELEEDKGIITLSNTDKLYAFADSIVGKLGAK